MGGGNTCRSVFDDGTTRWRRTKSLGSQQEHLRIRGRPYSGPRGRPYHSPGRGDASSGDAALGTLG
jgi:hypothetical protein